MVNTSMYHERKDLKKFFICYNIFLSLAHRGDNFVIEYLDEIETEFENTSACSSGAQMGLTHEKTVENLVTHSL